MITPTEAPTRNQLQQQAVEFWFDRMLNRGTRKIDYPHFWQLSAHSDDGFYLVRTENIDAVLNKYRALGWTISGDGPWMFSN
jgi:hypothetical protein